jgi:hypothetical protein
MHIAYDTQSGRIVAIHHGHGDTGHAAQLAHYYARFVADAPLPRRDKAAASQIAVISVPSDAVKPGKAYAVDVHRKQVVEAAPDEQGVGFSVRTIARYGTR